MQELPFVFANEILKKVSWWLGSSPRVKESQVNLGEECSDRIRGGQILNLLAHLTHPRIGGDLSLRKPVPIRSRL